MFDFGDELTIESYRIPWLVWIQILVMLLLVVLLFCFSLSALDLPDRTSSASASLCPESQLDKKPVFKQNTRLVSTCFQASQATGLSTTSTNCMVGVKIVNAFGLTCLKLSLQFQHVGLFEEGIMINILDIGYWQVGEIHSMKGEIATGTSRRIGRGEDTVEKEGPSSKEANQNCYHPCHYLRLAKLAFLKCLGLDSSSESSLTNEQRNER
ncbi:Uncharacterized protein TCM_001236 [Theobroma cacao]|uniref:Uncharacterized protein n=1 Tax=Theobroma cacao TaxID=3641 RepID=A0A061DQQ0_THECC|nr:Uncharacterized protein TCM_001236 [Theobroma cacao]